MVWKHLKRFATYPVQFWNISRVLLSDRKATKAQNKLISLQEASSWGFAGSSVIVGILSLAAAFDNSVAIQKASTTVLVTLAMWIVLSTISYFVSRHLGGTGDFLETASNTVAVMAVVYVTSGLAAAIGGLLVRPFFSSALSWIVPSSAFFATQFVLAWAHLPRRLRLVHALTDRSTKLTRAIAVLVLAGNLALAGLPALLAGVQGKAANDQESTVVALNWPNVPPIRPVWGQPPIHFV